VEIIERLLQGPRGPRVDTSNFFSLANVYNRPNVVELFLQYKN
jgi:hypothetical protein